MGASTGKNSIGWKVAQLPRPALAGLVVFTLLVTFVASEYVKSSRLIESKFRSGSLQTVSEVFASPRLVQVGDAITPADLIAHLTRSGYGENVVRANGSFTLGPQGLQIQPGPSSYLLREPVTLTFARNRIAKILLPAKKATAQSVLLEPELISNLTDKSRSRRRLVQFHEIPRVLLQAVTSVEDKRFFQHTGFDVLRIGKAAYVDLREGRKEQGASTLSMQLARNVFLDSEKTWDRKASEAFLTLLLEAKFSKEQLFEFYSNEVYLGQKGTFNIHGFGEASQDFFAKDLSAISLPEAALLAGIIQRPSYFNPFRWPDRALARRKVVLGLMAQNGYIDSAQLQQSNAAPIRLASRAGESTDAPYFLDFVNDAIPTHLQGGENDLHTAH